MDYLPQRYATIKQLWEGEEQAIFFHLKVQEQPALGSLQGSVGHIAGANLQQEERNEGQSNRGTRHFSAKVYS
jgi:hypothetical protein